MPQPTTADPLFPDLAVIGAGPAGVHAALAAAGAGLRVTLVDESPHAGGQVFRAPLDGSPASGEDGRVGAALRQALAASRVVHLPGQRVWTVSTAPLGLSLAGANGVRRVRPRAVLVATGATERVVPFPGWTLPGVIGLAAATILLKAPGALPAGPIVLAGRGPLLAATAAGLLARGATIACVVDEATRADWARALPALLATPRLLAKGARWLVALRRAGVPVLHGHEVTAAQGTEAIEAVRIGRIDRRGRERLVPARVLAIGHGLVPATDILRLFGVPMQQDPRDGSWLPQLDPQGRTGLPGLYAAGDGTGIHGAGAAAAAGRLAGLAVAGDLGALPPGQRDAPALRRQLRRAAGVGRAMAALMAPPAARLAAIPPATIVCRCEDVTRAEIDQAFHDGVRDMNQLKARTRCGMGPCQGRVCGPIAAALAAIHPEAAVPLLPWTVRPPLGALPIASLVGEFGYDDIPAVRPAI